MIRKIISWVMFLVLVLGGSVDMVRADGVEKSAKGYDIMLVIDSSESMAESFGIEGSRLEVVKMVLTDMVGDLPESTYMGLRVSGGVKNEKEQLLEKTKLLIPVGKIDRVEFIDEIDKLFAKDIVEMSGSLDRLVDDFVQKPDYGAYVILINAEGDVSSNRFCETREKMEKKEGFVFNIDVVGLDIDQKYEEDLKCIAETAGGGTYSNSKNKEELEKNLKTSFNKILGEEIFVIKNSEEETTSMTDWGGTAFNERSIDAEMVSEEAGLSARVIAGIVAVGVLLVGGVVALVVVIRRRREKEASIAIDEQTLNVPAVSDNQVPVRPVEENEGEGSNLNGISRADSVNSESQIPKREFGQVLKGSVDDIEQKE